MSISEEQMKNLQAIADSSDSVILKAETLRMLLAELRAKGEPQKPSAIVSSVVDSGDKGVRVKWLGGFPQIGDRLYTAPPAQAVSLTTPAPSVSCVPEGWKLVQRGCVTPEMKAAGNSATDDVYWSVVDVFNAMLAAAPSPTGLDNPEAPNP